MSSDLPDGPPRRRPGWAGSVAWRRLVVENLLVVAVFAVAGAAGGWLWLRLWDAPEGYVGSGAWGYNGMIEAGRVFSGTGLFTVIGGIGGLVLGVVFAMLCRVSELVTLVAVAVGSAVAAYLAVLVGMAQSPVNPRVLALMVPDRTTLPDQLTLTGPTPYVAWTLGAMLGLSVTYLFTTGVSAGTAEARRIELTTPAAPGTDSQPSSYPTS